MFYFIGTAILFSVLFTQNTQVGMTAPLAAAKAWTIQDFNTVIIQLCGVLSSSIVDTVAAAVLLPYCPMLLYLPLVVDLDNCKLLSHLGDIETR